ncbi:hypothetical protein METHPM2_340022 [Pseudomonas sp. PM2]
MNSWNGVMGLRDIHFLQGEQRPAALLAFAKNQVGLGGLSGLDAADGHAGFNAALAWAADASELFSVGLLGGDHHAQQNHKRADDLALECLHHEAAHCLGAQLEAGRLKAFFCGVRAYTHDATNLFHRQIGSSPQGGFKLARSQAHLEVALPVSGCDGMGGHEIKYLAVVRCMQSYLWVNLSSIPKGY